MYFKKLELVGFKSFNEKTTLNFEPGITAIVGPNGCGKSNIFDSIRWVLGEQSAKSLRGSDMQDVIFNGTDLKEALGMAEVTLAFDNEKRFFNVDHPEVAITRRLFRSGESEYLLNKTPVRLKDILDIFMGTGIGAESYSLVAQGKIDLVLSSRPEDRRLVFDEAAGITKYKAQKRETTRKLEETEQNLLRVNDIITEVKRQIGSLERQANKARKYKEVFEELKSKELSLSLVMKLGLLKQKEEIASQLKDLHNKETGLATIIQELEAKISSRQSELKVLEEKMMNVKNEIFNLQNSVVRNNEHISFNQERIKELAKNEEFFIVQLAQVKSKLIQDEDKLNNVKDEFDGIKQNIALKSQLLGEKETRINNLAASIKASLEKISLSKKNIMDLVAKIAANKNEISDTNAKQQIYLSRKKRLEIEKAKVYEEKAITEASLKEITAEVEGLKTIVEGINLKVSGVTSDLRNEAAGLAKINSDIEGLERERASLESHREFLRNLKTKYEGIGESMNALVYLDKPPAQNLSGLVIKIKDTLEGGLKLSGEAKPIELDTQKIDEKINNLQLNLDTLRCEKTKNEMRIEALKKVSDDLAQELRNSEITLANKDSVKVSVSEQFSKIKEEEDVVVLELCDVNREITVIGKNLEVQQSLLEGLNKEHRQVEDTILQEESSISLNSKQREEVLVVITQTKTELDALYKKISSDEVTLKILEDTYRHDKESLENLEKQTKEAAVKLESLEAEISDCQEKTKESGEGIRNQNNLLKQFEGEYQKVFDSSGDVVSKIEADRKQLDSIKKNVYELDMQAKDIDYQYASIKDRMLQAYKLDLESIEETAQITDKDTLAQEIVGLKQRLDSYGTVNLVAIEEYDELKKRYDFLIQQQNDLASAKESLHQAILKINRTTKQMFLETFEKVKVEFRNYFKLLFNGGDAQVYLIDEQDPLESGIEIICRPPGKKLQNVLLLSGGEKSMSAIALIFAIFKVKPSPFCILDEIDAALDEANVDRFSRMLLEFAKISQFIVITHNKKTIANADVMYGITMQQSGISKIVSVKFAQKDKEQQVQVAEPV